MGFVLVRRGLPLRAAWSLSAAYSHPRVKFSSGQSRSARRERFKRGTKPKTHDPLNRPHFSRFHKGRTSECMEFLFRVAGVSFDRTERIKTDQLQRVTRTVVGKLEGTNKQTLVDVVVSCSKLGNMSTDLTRATRMEVVRALGAMCREREGVNAAYSARLRQATAQLRDDKWGFGMPVVRLLHDTTGRLVACCENFRSRLCRSLGRIRDELPATRSVCVEQARNEEESIEAMRRRALQFRRLQSGGRVPHENMTDNKGKTGKAALGSSWFVGKFVLVLDRVISYLKPDLLQQPGNSTNSNRSTEADKVTMTDGHGSGTLFTNMQLVTLLKSLSSARYYDSALMDAILLHFLARLTISDTNMHQVADMMYSCSRLSYHHPDLVNRVLAILSKKRGWLLVAVPDDACKILWSLSVLGLVNEAILEMGSERMRRLGKRGGKFSSMQRRQLAQVRAVADGNPDNYDNCNRLLRKWVERAPTCSSGFHRRIGNVLSDLGYKHESEVNLANGLAQVDIALVKHKIVVEADGPTHYTVNHVDGKPWMLGSTKLRNNVINRLGWKVVDIPFFEWQSLESNQKVSYLKSRIDEVRRAHSSR